MRRVRGAAASSGIFLERRATRGGCIWKKEVEAGGGEKSMLKDEGGVVVF